MKKNKIPTTLNPYQRTPGTKFGPKGIGDNQPPKKPITVKALIIIILEYSPRKNKANPIAEYSVK
tara:strand:- start:440 stop:634 length:195 start_codon:yes stop_codon:yes gene_type:complete